MALIRCPECNKEVSDTCDVCIHCGYKLKHRGDDGFDFGFKYDGDVGGDRAEYDDLAARADLFDGYTEPSSYKLRRKFKPNRSVLKVIGIIFGVLLAAASVAFVIYIIATHDSRDALLSEIMATVAILLFTGGVTCTVLCSKLL